MVDFLWREHRLVVETDGARVHGTASARRSDARRDRSLEQLGFRVLRFSYDEVARSASEVAARVASALVQRQRSTR